MTRSEDLEQIIQPYLNKRQVKKLQFKEAKSQHGKLSKELSVILEAYSIIKTAAAMSTDNLKNWIEKTINSGFNIVFPDLNLKLFIDFTAKGCEIKIYEGSSEINIYDIGGGALDILNVLLQICLVILQKKSRVIIMDEPLKHLAEVHQPIAARLLSQLCSELNLQIIMVTHSKKFTEPLTEGVVNL